MAVILLLQRLRHTPLIQGLIHLQLPLRSLLKLKLQQPLHLLLMLNLQIPLRLLFKMILLASRRRILLWNSGARTNSRSQSGMGLALGDTAIFSKCCLYG